MDFLSQLLKLVDQYGLMPVVVILLLVGGYFIMRGVISTWNKVALSNAEARNRTEKAEADSTTTLSQSIREMAESNNAIVRVTIEGMKSAEAERSRQFNVLTEMLGQIRGVALAQSDDLKARRAMATTLNNIDDRITGPLQTDLHDINLRTAGFESSFTKLLDLRVEPLVILMMGMNTQINAIATIAQVNGQNIEAITTETTKISQYIAKLVSELTLFKDLFFDRDERLAGHMQHIVNALDIKDPTS